jgi:SAM-dependent methyltransferase
MSEPRDMRLDNPMLVRWEFASEERLETRNAIYHQLLEGESGEAIVFAAVREVQPSKVLEVGGGAGAMSERIKVELNAQVTAVDISERMVDLTRERGIHALVADVQSLPFEDGTFDCVVAAWVFYHVADRAKAIGECARVLAPGGRLVASTMADDNLDDLWVFLGHPRERRLSFSTTNGAEQLRPFFEKVEAREAEGVVVFPTPEAMRRYVAANMVRAHLAEAVPETFAEPVRARTHHTVFVADKAA